MASILDRYGIKEVADVTFYKIDKTTGEPKNPVLYLDTLKVSTIEQTAETADARGGKGNPKLVTWDYGKDISVTLEDALFSAKSLSIMFGNGEVTLDSKGYVTKTTTVKLVKDSDTVKLPKYFTADVLDANGGAVRKRVYALKSDVVGEHTDLDTVKDYLKIEKITSEKGTVYSQGTVANGVVTTSAAWSVTDSTGNDAPEEGDRVFITYQVKAATKEIVISGDTFPGTYYVTGDTYARSDIDGSDQFFQFIIPKAKVTSENTITLEAEGDPSVFNMNLTVLRPEDGEMMKLVQYDLDDWSEPSSSGLDE